VHGISIITPPEVTEAVAVVATRVGIRRILEMSGPKKKSSMKRKLLALAISVLASFLVAEVLVRVLVGSPYVERLPIMRMQANPHRGWEMVPGEDHYTYHHLVRVNSHGLRGPEIGAKAEGTTRVLVLGDSLVYGQGVGEDETLPHYLEVLLEERKPGSDWEVINGGHRAYATHQELALLEELGSELHPDVVVCLWYWNDTMERDVEATYERWKDREPVAFDTGTTIEGWEWWKWQGKQLVRRSALANFLYDTIGKSGGTPTKQEVYDGGILRLDRYLGRFLALGERMGFRFVFAIIPDPNALLGPHESIDVNRDAADKARARGIPALDLTPPVRRLYEEEDRMPVIPFDGHYLPEGNRAMAGALADHILEGR